jgi:glycosyltransferase involved in cell wall biosynthesis
MTSVLAGIGHMRGDAGGIAGGAKTADGPAVRRTPSRLTVLQVAYPFAPVGPDAVGGAEQILSMLDRALARTGHRSIVVACEGSRVAGELRAHPFPPGEIDEAARASAHAAMRAAIAAVLRAEPVDLVHLHGIDFHAYLPPPGPPCLITLHLPPAWYPASALSPTRSDTWLHCVSAAQHRACPPSRALLPPIPNGVPVDALTAHRHARRSFALMLGRICPEKGQHLALEAARTADTTLLLAGEVFPYAAHQDYFAAEVAPRLDRRRRWIGPIGFTRKRRLLNAARCLLVPSLAEETASLAAMEALACGTPVIAFPAGALADLVEHGRTGFLERDVSEMAAAIRRAGEIDPVTCRQVAHERFSDRVMINAYLACYETLAWRRATAERS